MRTRSGNRPSGARLVLALAGTTLSVVGLAGCSAGAPATATPVPIASAVSTQTSVVTPAPAPTPTIEPTPDLAAIGAAYLAAADRFNPVLAGSLFAFADSNNTQEDRAGIAGDIVAAFDQVIADFDAIDFPPAIEADVAGMRAAFVAIRDDFQLTASHPSHDPLPVYEDQVAIYKQFADKVRAYLGLPPRPTDPPA